MAPLVSMENEIKKNCESLMNYIATAMTFAGNEYVYEIDGTKPAALVVPADA
jgi:hypothetical protein